MKRTEALEALMFLTQCTPGWDADAITIFTNEIERWHDPGALKAAIHALSMRWDRRSRPMMFDIKAAYDSEVRQRQMDLALPSGEQSTTYPTLEEGCAIARKAYEGECRRLGKEPNPDIFDSWVFTLANKRAQRLKAPLAE